MKKIAAFLVGVFVFLACSESDKSLPIEEDVLANIVYDLMKDRKELTYVGVSIDSMPLYFHSQVKPAVLQKYKVSKADFDSSYVIISQNPARFEEFWKQVKVVADSAYSKYQ